MPDKKEIHALDVGTGAGFFAFLLKDMGATDVTGIDYSRSMVENAKTNSKKLGYTDIRFFEMDAQNLDFEENFFDFIISRNVTWTLSDPEKGYEEWCRVLAPGGLLLNFDANYGQSFKGMDVTEQANHQSRYYSKVSYRYPAQSPEMIKERNEIAEAIYICDFMRPQWDVDVLLRNGITNISINTDISRQIYAHDTDLKTGAWEKDNDRKMPGMFMVRALKNGKDNR